MHDDLIPPAPGAQLPTIADVWRDPALVRESIGRTFARRHEPQARYLQFVMLMSPRVVDEFWCAPQLRHFSTRRCACDSDARGRVLVLVGVGAWHLPTVSDDVLAGCIACADDIVRAPGPERSLLDLGSLDAVLAWLRGR